MASVQNQSKMPDHMFCCKSQFKLQCSVCNHPINRGDEITQIAESRGMELRGRTYKNGFYTPFTHSKWLHKCCSTIGSHGCELNMYLIDQWSSNSNSESDDYSDSDTSTIFCGNCDTPHQIPVDEAETTRCRVCNVYMRDYLIQDDYDYNDDY